MVGLEGRLHMTILTLVSILLLCITSSTSQVSCTVWASKANGKGVNSMPKPGNPMEQILTPRWEARSTFSCSCRDTDNMKQIVIRTRCIAKQLRIMNDRSGTQIRSKFPSLYIYRLKECSSGPDRDQTLCNTQNFTSTSPYHGRWSAQKRRDFEVARLVRIHCSSWYVPSCPHVRTGTRLWKMRFYFLMPVSANYRYCISFSFGRIQPKWPRDDQ